MCENPEIPARTQPAAANSTDKGWHYYKLIKICLCPSHRCCCAATKKNSSTAAPSGIAVLSELHNLAADGGRVARGNLDVPVRGESFHVRTADCCRLLREGNIFYLGYYFYSSKGQEWVPGHWKKYSKMTGLVTEE